MFKKVTSGVGTVSTTVEIKFDVQTNSSFILLPTSTTVEIKFDVQTQLQHLFYLNLQQ